MTKALFQPQSPIFTTCSVDRTVRQWDARTGRCLRVWKGHQDVVLDLDVASDGRRLVTCGDDGVCLVFSDEQCRPTVQ